MSNKEKTSFAVFTKKLAIQVLTGINDVKMITTINQDDILKEIKKSIRSKYNENNEFLRLTLDISNISVWSAKDDLITSAESILLYNIPHSVKREKLLTIFEILQMSKISVPINEERSDNSKSDDEPDFSHSPLSHCSKSSNGKTSDNESDVTQIANELDNLSLLNLSKNEIIAHKILCAIDSLATQIANSISGKFSSFSFPPPLHTIILQSLLKSYKTVHKPRCNARMKYDPDTRCRNAAAKDKDYCNIHSRAKNIVPFFPFLPKGGIPKEFS